MVDRPSLSKGELDVARALWKLGNASVRQVHEALAADCSWEFSTVQTYLRRLEAKGYVTAKLDGRTRVYRAKVKPRTVIRETVDDLVDRLFDGDSLPLVRHLIEDRRISPDELDELKNLIDRMEDES